jgi:hypothetical protein
MRRTDQEVAGATTLLARPDFRRVYAAGAISQLGDAFQFVALLWYAVLLGGPLGVLAARIATSLPSLVFGLHGGAVADRWDRRRTMIAADLVRGTILLPVALAGLTGRLSLWGVVAAGLIVTTASAYFAPALGAFLPSVVGRRNTQPANGLVTATNNVALLGGWAVAAGLLAILSVGAFFAVNAASFFVSAALIARTEPRPVVSVSGASGERLLSGLEAMRVRPGLRSAVGMHALGVAVNTGVWTVGIAVLARSELGSASGLSLLLVATSVGAIAATGALARIRLQRQVLASCLAWCLLPLGYVLIAVGGDVPAALAGTFLVGFGAAAALVLVTSATQRSVDDSVLGRAMGIVFLGNLGAKPVGLLLIAPLYAFFAPTAMFLGGAAVLLVCALAAAGRVDVATRRAVAA